MSASGWRRAILALVVVGALISLFFARRGVAPESAVRVVVWHSQRGAEKDTLEALLRTFNERHAGRIWAEPLAVPDASFKDKVLRTVPRGAGPDLFLRPHNELGELLRDDVLAPIDPKTLPVSPERHLPGLCEGVSRDGTLYGAPITFKALVLFYDKRVFPDGPPRALDALLADRTRPHPLVYDATSFFFHAPFYLAAGGRFEDSAGVPSPFDGPGAASFAQPKEWKARGLIPADIGYNDAVRLFEEGSAATLLNGPWYTPPKSAEAHVGVAPLPSVDGKPMGSLVTVEAVFVARSTKHPEQARELLAFLVSQEAATLRSWGTLGRGTPRRSPSSRFRRRACSRDASRLRASGWRRFGVRRTRCFEPRCAATTSTRRSLGPKRRSRRSMHRDHPPSAPWVSASR
jgi:maltose-binding protein MalE